MMENKIPYSDYDEKMRLMGLETKALLKLHLENPKTADAVTILAYLFDRFEEAGIELEEGKHGEHI